MKKSDIVTLQFLALHRVCKKEHSVSELAVLLTLYESDIHLRVPVFIAYEKVIFLNR